ncbi:hypothetical protein CBL_11436 [Carabus blaptoides fortunei]
MFVAVALHNERAVSFPGSIRPDKRASAKSVSVLPVRRGCRSDAVTDCPQSVLFVARYKQPARIDSFTKGAERPSSLALLLCQIDRTSFAIWKSERSNLL